MEAIIPTEIQMPTIQTEVPEEVNVEAITKDLDATDELREAIVVRIASYQRLANLHNQHVKPRIFKVRELVLRRVFKNTANPTDGEIPGQLGRNIHGGSSKDSRVLCVEQTKRDCCSQDVELHAS